MTPPTGTITFLFTDIEGSTRLWGAQPEAMTAALRRHDAILRETLTGHEGHIFKTVGDGFYCAFATADRAVEAALTTQRALVAESWPDATGPLRVRMALHTGAADERDGDYFGPALNRAARLLAAGHGSQVLLSAAAAELAAERLSPGVALVDLGSYQLKDLVAPETIYQLTVADLPAAFPPLRTLDAARHNLPVQATPLIGRRAHVAAVAGLLRRPDVRLITLTGVGGTGKTRLSLQVAAEVADEYEHGVFFIDLTQVTEPGAIPLAIIGALGLAAPSREDPRPVVEKYLGSRQMLLLLDNFEQVIPGAPLVAGLLAAAPRLEVVVTSRELLSVSGEYEYAVPPLTLPDLAQPLSPADYMGYESIALFVSRATATRGDFQLTDENAHAVAEICARLDGLPLAIELAAARTRLFTPQALLARLGERLDALGRGPRDRPERHQTLRGAIDWSYNLLDEAERTLFRRLAVFSGGWEIEAAEAICGGALPVEVIDGLESLLNKSLIRRIEGRPDEPRFGMLVTIGDYAREQLAAGGEEGALRQGHTDYFYRLAIAGGGELRGHDQMAWMGRLNAEIENIRAALGHFLDSGDPSGVRMAAGLRDYWLYSYQHVEGEAWLRRALALAERVDLPALVDVMTALGMVLQHRNKVVESTRMLEEAERQAVKLGDPRRLAWTVMWQSVSKAAVYGLDMLPELRRRGRESVEMLRAAGDMAGVTQSLNIVGEVLRLSGDLDAAEAVYQEIIPLAQQIGDVRRVVFQYANLATIGYERGEMTALLSYARLGLPLSLRYHVDETAAFFLIFMGVLFYRSGRGELAGRLVGAAERWHEEMTVVPQASDIPVETRMKDEVRRGLGEDVYRAAWAAGRKLSLAEAAELAEEACEIMESGGEIERVGD